LTDSGGAFTKSVVQPASKGDASGVQDPVNSSQCDSLKVSLYGPRFGGDLDFSDRANTLADVQYHDYFSRFGTVLQIERFPCGHETHLLDREFAIDVRIHVKPLEGKLEKVVFTLQEKFRRPSYQRFQDITIEYFQDRHSNELGDWSKLAVEYYAYGYASHDETPGEFLEFYLLDYPLLKQLLAMGIIPYEICHSSSRASMLTVPLGKIPRRVVVFSKTDLAKFSLMEDFW